MRKGEVKIYCLEKIYRTDNPETLALLAALRAEDFDAAVPLVEKALARERDRSYADIVHNNDEIYPIAQVKHGVAGAVEAPARSELGGPKERAPLCHKGRREPRSPRVC